MGKSEPAQPAVPNSVSYWKLYSVATLPTYTLLAVGFLSAVVLGATTPIFYLEIGEIFDKMQDHRGDKDDFYDAVVEIVYILLIIGAIALVTGYIAVFCFSRAGAQIASAFKSLYFQSLLSQDIAFYDSRNCAELPSNVTTDCYKIQQATGEKAMVFVKVASYVITGLIVCFLSCPVLTLIALGQGPIIFIGMGLVGYTHSVRAKKQQSAYAGADGVAQESLTEVKTVVACCGQDTQLRKYEDKLTESRNTSKSIGLLHGLGWSFVSIARGVSAGVVFWYGAKLIKDDDENWIWGDTIDPSDVVVVFFVVGAVFQFLGNLVPSIHAIVEGKQAAFRAFGVIDRKPELVSGNMKPEVQGSIRFQDVSFAYPNAPDLIILDEVSFSIDKGKKLGLVGESGAGKSTVIQLLERFYDPYSGAIYLDNVDLRHYDLQYLRSVIGLVSQEPVLFSTTIRENLLLGASSVSEADLNWAIESSNAKSFITDFDEKLDTMVGVNGSKLSGGQKQRIAIARALLRHPKILLLDEATSSLDARNEMEIQDMLENLVIDLHVTCIIIAQKLSNVRKCDHIVLLEKGVVEEEGTHESLMQARGKYHHLVTLQGMTVERISEVSTSANNSEQNDEATEVVSEGETPLGSGETVKKVLKISAHYWYFVALASVMAILAGATFPVFGLLIAEEMHFITEQTGEEMLDHSRNIAIWLFILAVVSFLAYFLMSYSITTLTASLTAELRALSFRSLLNHDFTFFDRKENNAASLTTSLSSDCEKTNNAGGPLIAMAVMMLASLTVGSVLGLCFAWRLGLVITACTPLLTLGMMRGYLVKVESSELKEYDAANVICSDAIMNIRTTASLNAQQQLATRYQKENSDVTESQLKGTHLMGVFFGFGLMAMFYVYALAFWYGAYQVKHNGVKTEDMNIALYSCLMGSIGMMVASIFAPDLAAGRKAAARLFSIIDYQSTTLSGTEKTSIEGHIEFKNVYFRYPSRDSLVLKDFSLLVPAGSCIGIAGSSGAGKSTIVQLLFRFYDPSQGHIFIDDIDMKSFDITTLRRQMAVVFQEPVLFSGSVKDNIRFGCEEVSEVDILLATDMAQASKFINKHADGLQRNVGIRGSNLSAGQKQRVAIARALVRKPKILIFDEATSALDAKTEKKLQVALKAAQLNRTCIIIAHRPSTLQEVSSVVVVEEGQVKEVVTSKQMTDSLELRK